MRIQVNVSDKLAEKLTNYANAIGVSRSQLCTVFIGQAIMGLDKAIETVDSINRERALADEIEGQVCFDELLK